ncbi:MAG: hypothetical protein PVF91_09025 [Chromatiales bacterium]|jgi:hypothetical protein
MTSPQLENLVRIGALKPEPYDRKEFENLVRSGRVRLRDAHNAALSGESRFDLAYNAAHALALAALRSRGYRTDKRYFVFQCLPHTLGLGPEIWRVLALCHERRNKIEYEGLYDIEEQLITDLITAADRLLVAVEQLESP